MESSFFEKVKGYYIHKSIILPDNQYILKLKKNIDDDHSEIEIIFNECLTIDDMRLYNIAINDIAINDKIGIKYIFLTQKYKINHNDYKQFVLFDKEKEEQINTGVVKKSIINIIFKSFNIK